MTTQPGPVDTGVPPAPIGTTTRHGRLRIVVLLTALGTLMLTIALTVITLTTRTGGPPSAVLAPRPAAAPPAPRPASPSGSRSSGPTITQPALPAAPPRVPDQYRMVRLGFSGAVKAMNGRGDLVGARVFSGTPRHPFLWRDGKLIDLGELTPTYDGSGEATDINNRGAIVGFSRIGSKAPPVDERAFIWRSGVMTALMAPNTNSVANAINDRAQVVGTYTVGEVSHAFLWEDGVVTDLGTGQAIDINERGQVIGTNARGAWMWLRGRFTYLSAEPAGNLGVVAINNAGWVVTTGWIERDDDMPDGRAFLWRSGRATDLGSIGVGFTSPRAINDWAQIVGATNHNNFDDPIPFLWQRGVMIDLSERGVPRQGSVTCVNNRGQLAGNLWDPHGAADGQVVLYI
jgi:probable HAF family extracellular repeat protein